MSADEVALSTEPPQPRKWPVKRQYGVQIVWADPVKAGAIKPGEPYVPKWLTFDTVEQADSFAARYRFDRAVDGVNQATRWALEHYGPWEPSA